MIDNEVVVVIPTYKEFNQLTSDEIKSFHQCYKILKDYKICIVHALNLNIQPYEYYIKINFNKESFSKTFNNDFFTSISGYNDLMLSTQFYKSFVEFKYLLIYQLDCWVFKDQLKNWCQLDYDYIGAPIFRHFGTNEGGNNIDVIGNGGFSLRKINKFLNVLTWKGNIMGIKYFFKRFKQQKNLKAFLKIFIGVAGYHNTVPYLLKFYKKNLVNEDVFFSYNFQDNSPIQIRVPDINTSIKFAFDRSPQFLFKLNENQLPFGCHGWNRKDTIYFKEDKIFWEQFIK